MIEHAPTIVRSRLARAVLGRKWGEIFNARASLGYVPNLHCPKSFNEKVIYRKLYQPPPNAAILSDKLAVREFVRHTVGSRYLIPLLAVYQSADEIDFETLPEPFIIKATHGNGSNLKVVDRSTACVASVKRKCRQFLKTRFGHVTNEDWYLDIPPRLMVESLLMEDGLDEPRDFKIFVFHGRPAFVQVDFDRSTRHTRTFYSPSWELLDMTLVYPLGPAISPPPDLSEMLDVAAKLARDVDFVRVDLYNPRPNCIRFGELTFAPQAGWGRFGPTSDVDFRVGSLWRLNATDTHTSSR
jgi:hypothetical protein